MAPLAYLERPAEPEPEGLLVLHHGRGTDAGDLLGLADALDPGRRLRVVAPRAPLSLPGSPGYHWYLVPRVGYPDHETFHVARAALAELHDRLWAGDRRRPGADRARRLLDGRGDELRDGPERRSPGGRRESSPSAASCRRSSDWEPALGDRQATRAFIAHGRRDPIIEVGFGRRARDLLEAGGLEVTYRESDVGHQIDPSHLADATAWVGETLAS